MRFDPKTEQEIASANLLPPGTYDAEVIKAEEAKSSAGNDMIALTLRVYGSDTSTLVNDWLLEKVAYKLRHAAEAMGLLADYEQGALDARDMLNRSVRVKLNIQKDKAAQYPDKNGVADYIVDKAVNGKAATPARARQSVPAESIDDEIPF